MNQESDRHIYYNPITGRINNQERKLIWDLVSDQRAESIRKRLTFIPHSRLEPVLTRAQSQEVLDQQLLNLRESVDELVGFDEFTVGRVSTQSFPPKFKYQWERFQTAAIKELALTYLMSSKVLGRKKLVNGYDVIDALLENPVKTEAVQWSEHGFKIRQSSTIGIADVYALTSRENVSFAQVTDLVDLKSGIGLPERSSHRKSALKAMINLSIARDIVKQALATATNKTPGVIEIGSTASPSYHLVVTGPPRETDEFEESAYDQVYFAGIKSRRRAALFILESMVNPQFQEPALWQEHFKLVGLLSHV